eukprot:GFYU01004338.1.p1 GENE.GFYU01004338.1~~GFYU01004338.1.p1  ORF type:complete len:461 (-),score=36.95 GFYU01004338.1:21-1370(-)
MVFRCVLFLCGVALSAAAPGFADRPIMGWSSWNSFGININETLIRQSADVLSRSALLAAGYNYILIDDGWTACEVFTDEGECAEVPPRDHDGRIPVDNKKFPSGMAALTKYVHSLGLKIGIYTSVSAITCGGYIGSLNNEGIDAKTFADWGFDFVKHDTCGTDCGIHDGCIQGSAKRMATSLADAKKDIIYYLDHGNPTSPQRVFNPHNYHVSYDEALVKVATSKSELVWYYVSEFNTSTGPHMFKSSFDIKDFWESTMFNAHNQIRIAEYQSCGRFSMPDMLTVGMGGQTEGQYRAQFFLWTILGAPLIAGNDIRHMNQFTVDLLTAREVLAVNQDPDCVQGSLVRSLGSWESWIRPLSDKTFAVVLLNKGDTETTATVYIDRQKYYWGDFYPAFLQKVSVRDLFEQKDMGSFTDKFEAVIPPMDAKIYKFTPEDEDFSEIDITFSVE